MENLPAVKPKIKVVNIRGEYYVYKKFLAKGNFGKVYLIEKEYKKYALKIVLKKKLSEESNRKTRLERDVLSDMSGVPFFVDLHCAYEDDKAHYFVLGYCAGGNLFQRLVLDGPFTEDFARFYIGEISVAVEFLHQRCFIHRDLKLENVLLQADGHIALVDFGLAKVTINYYDMGLCGTPRIMAPEMLQKKGYNTAVDIWALGIMSFEMLTGLHPFRTDLKKMVEKIKFDEPEMPEPNNLSNITCDFIKNLLNKDPKQRPYACEVYSKDFNSYSLKKDPFFQKLDWNKLQNRHLPSPFVPSDQDPD